MNKTYFALTLLPKRPDFAQTMTGEERSIMQQHVAYWKTHMANGNVVVFGPLLRAGSTYGLGIVAVENKAAVQELIQNDPAARINTYEWHPMLAVVPETK